MNRVLAREDVTRPQDLADPKIARYCIKSISMTLGPTD
jgi:hypothetical protein